jgi:FSR family fosmidomycin resistance protein-like MFS transporter
VPLLVGGLLELPLGVLAGQGRGRRRAVLGGGILFLLTLVGVAAAHSFAVLLCAFIAFYPASGAFVSLTQAELVDTFPERQAQVMARWDLAGSAGAVAGPLLLTAVLTSGGGWRAGYLVLAGVAAVAWLGAYLRGPARSAEAGPGTDPEPADPEQADPEQPDPEQADPDRAEPDQADPERPWTERVREILAALRDWGTLRWLLLIEVADLLVDVFTGFLALYLVDVAHLTPAVAALAIAVRLGAALAGDAALVLILERVGDLTVLRASAAAAALLYPGFLLVPGAAAKLAVLALLSAATAPWYPVLQARLYGSLPGRSSVAVTLSSAAGLAGGLGPLAVGLAAQWFGLSWALAGLVLVPVAVLLAPGRGRSARPVRSGLWFLRWPDDGNSSAGIALVHSGGALLEARAVPGSRRPLDPGFADHEGFPCPSRTRRERRRGRQGGGQAPG